MVLKNGKTITMYYIQKNEVMYLNQSLATVWRISLENQEEIICNEGGGNGKCLGLLFNLISVYLFL